MARIPSSEVVRLKNEVSLQRLVEARGIKLRRHGADLIGRCPFHDDRTPSLVVSPAKNLWHCLGACQTGGSVIDWVMKAEGVSFRHAVELLRADMSTVSSGARTASGSRPVIKSTVPKLPAPVAAEAEDRELLLQVVGYYHESLKQSPEAIAYLEIRGLRSSEMVERFRLGFANRTLGLRLPAKNRQAGEALRGRLTELGFIRASGHEHLNGSLVIPVFDETGAVVEMYGRKITPGLRKGTPLHLYLPGPHRGVWNLEALTASKEIILCESLIDALTFWCAGYRNVTASYGVEGFTADHLAAFRQHGTERVLIAYDRDEAGDRAAVKLSDKLSAEGIATYRVQFPRGMDANEYALKGAQGDAGGEEPRHRASQGGVDGQREDALGTGESVAGPLVGEQR
jgi:DNA primase catalytic core